MEVVIFVTVIALAIYKPNYVFPLLIPLGLLALVVIGLISIAGFLLLGG